MPTISAENYDISIREGFWQLIPTGNAVSTRPAFRITRGGGVMEYTPHFGETHRLPGTILSVEYVRSVVVGYNQKSRRWLLGFHVAQSASDQPRWLELVRWPAGENLIYAAAAEQAGQELAEHIGCDLKIFGAKKPPSAAPLTDRSDVTGPLKSHKRETIGPQQVKLRAQSIDLPIEYPHMWLGQTRGNLTLRLDREITASKRGTVAPVYTNCVIDSNRKTVRLVPPTGLLSAFLGGQQAREIAGKDVRNVELRHIVMRHSITRPDTDGTMSVTTEITHLWNIYLTLPDESLLLAQTQHTTSSELARHRATSRQFAANSEAGIEYLRRHQLDQQKYDRASTWAETAAIVLASSLGVHVVETELEEEQIA